LSNVIDSEAGVLLRLFCDRTSSSWRLYRVPRFKPCARSEADCTYV
jgi:hypothetical protein